MNYEEFEGKEVLYYDGKIVRKAIITGFDFDIGVSIQNKWDRGIYHACIHGAMSPFLKEHSIGYDDRIYRILFFTLVNWIRNKEIIDGGVLTAATPSVSNTEPSAEACAFGQ